MEGPGRHSCYRGRGLADDLTPTPPTTPQAMKARALAPARLQSGRFLDWVLVGFGRGSDFWAGSGAPEKNTHSFQRPSLPCPGLPVPS